MSKEEWLKRCAARFEQRGGLHWNQAEYYAEVCLKNIDNDLEQSPEDAADDDMSCWSD